MIAVLSWYHLGERPPPTMPSKRRKLAHAQLTEALAWNDDVKEQEDTETKGTEKRPPETKELFEMLWCEIEELHIYDACGMPADEPAYRGCLDLLKARASPDLAEAVRCTRAARLQDEDESVSDRTLDAKRVALFRDGTKLKELVELHRKKIPKAFGPLVSPAELKEAEDALAATEREQRRGATDVLVSLFKPEVPLYSLALVLMAFDSYTGPRTFHAMSVSLDGVHDGSLTMDDLRHSLAETYVKLVLCVFAHLTAWALTHKVTGRFSSAIRIEVLKGVLRMDTVFFDIHPSGVIQERINQDADSLSSKLFHLPIEILSSGLRLLTNSMAGSGSVSSRFRSVGWSVVVVVVPVPAHRSVLQYVLCAGCAYYDGMWDARYATQSRLKPRPASTDRRHSQAPSVRPPAPTASRTPHRHRNPRVLSIPNWTGKAQMVLC